MGRQRTTRWQGQSFPSWESPPPPFQKLFGGNHRIGLVTPKKLQYIFQTSFREKCFADLYFDPRALHFFPAFGKNSDQNWPYATRSVFSRFMSSGGSETVSVRLFFHKKLLEIPAKTPDNVCMHIWTPHNCLHVITIWCHTVGSTVVQRYWSLRRHN